MTVTSCDTLVVMGSTTKNGHTLFAKNSDRPPTECQPLLQTARFRYQPGATVRVQYLEIPQAAETLAVLGSRPWWLWGFEHGVNECRVAIGNEALPTRDELTETGLLGMDLVRLGLERGRTAADALRVITSLIEQYGQGGNAIYGEARRYHNSFIIADPGEAWILETSGRHWVSRQVRGRVAISNLVTIEDDWDEASSGIEAYARQRGWWTRKPGQRFNFRQAFENPDLRYRAEARLAASCRFLGSTGAPATADMMRHLRNHNEGGMVHRPGRKDGDPLGWSVCMHPNPGTSATAASLVAELPRDPAVSMALWCSQATPCTGIFLPVALDRALPQPLTRGKGTPDPASAWWAMKALSDAVMRDPGRLTPIVQEHWAAWEAALLQDAEPDRSSAGRKLGERVAEMLRRQRELLDRLG
jgi:dipeptidase